MAIRRFLGTAAAVKPVQPFTPGGTIGTETFSLAVNGKAVTYTAAGGDTAATVAAGLAAAWAASAEPEHLEADAAANGTTVTITGKVAGKPITITPAATGAATLTAGAATAASGPNHWSVAANWSGGAVPATGDDVVIDLPGAAIYYGLDQAAVTLASLVVSGDGAKVGLPEVAGAGTATYAEYRDRYLKIGATAVTVGGLTGGPSLLKLDTQAVQTTVNVRGTGQVPSGERAAIQWKGTHAANVLNVTRGTVAVAPYAGETATVATLRVGHQQNVAGDATVRCSSGVTLTDVDQSGGTLEIDSGTTTIDQSDGELLVRGGAHAALNLDGGACRYLSSGTLTAAKLGKATLDFGRDMRGRTVTNCTLSAGAKLLDPYGTATFTNGITLNRCGVEDVELKLGKHKVLTVAAA